MKKIFPFLFLIVFTSIFLQRETAAQVTVAGALVGNGSYTTLSAAFTAINGGAQTSANITISITANTSEPVTGAVLNNGAWTSITISPSGGAARTVTANVNGGLPLIDLNGADNVKIDGLNSGGNSLTISNTSTSNVSGTSTIRFQTDATNNIITRCSVLGSSRMPVNTNGGNIWFGSNSSSTGNDNNLISSCDIGPAGANLSTKGIYFSGTTTTTTLNNSGDTIRNCNIFDYFRDSTTSAGIYIGTGSTNTIIKDNKFYQTSSRAQLTGNQHAGIWIDNTSGNDYQISGNIIGSASSSGTGTYALSGFPLTKLYPIFINAGTTTATSIQGNTIFKLSLSGSITGTDAGTSLACIMVSAGLVNIGTTTGNTIGSQTDTSSITCASSSTLNTDVCGVYLGGSSNDKVSNNNFGGISASNSSTGNCIIFGIRPNNSTATDTLQNNIIGGTVANSIFNKTNVSSTRSHGIYSNNPTIYVTGNTIRNLTSAGGTSTNASSSVSGVTIVTGSVNHTISQNTIYNLKNTNTTDACFVNGIFYNSGNGTVSRNLIHTLSVGGNNSTFSGIHFNGGSVSCHNNMIRVGLDSSGNSISTGCTINGISETGGGNNFYFNSVYIGGTPTSGSNNTFAFASSVTGSRTHRNNIFYNARSNSGSTGKHYSVTIGSTTNITINNNIYFVTGSGGVLGLLSGNDYSTLSAWQTAVGQDANSFNRNPQYINPSGSASSLDLHISSSIATPVEANGFNVVAITDDYDGQTRSTLTPVDIGADAGNFIAIQNNVTLSGAIYDNGGYATLADAFSAINSYTQTSTNITLTINTNTTEPVTGAVLNAGAWTTLKIQPGGGASRTVSANVNAGSPLIDLNGADNVTIDGLNSGGNSLTISNTSTSSTSGTSTIRFQTDATNNIITRCTVLGSSTMSAGTEGGNIYFAGNAVTTGNDNNLVSSCDIGPLGSNLPSQGVVFIGTNTGNPTQNSGDTVRDCNIYDYFNATLHSSGVYIGTGCREIIIKNNKFYQTSARTQTTGSQHSAIWINTVFAGSDGAFTFSGNTIGSSSNSNTGTYSLTGTSSSKFFPIYVDKGNSGLVNIFSNTISKISFSGNISGQAFGGIYINSGYVDIGGSGSNTIGSMTDTSSISYSSSSASNSDVIGIYVNSSGPNTNTISNNNIGGVTASSSGSGTCAIYCVKLVSIFANISFQNNNIGGSPSNSINNKTNGNDTKTIGAYLQGKQFNSSGNIIKNLNSAGGTGTNENASVTGILCFNLMGECVISQNSVYNLKNTNLSSLSLINGFYLSSSAGNHTLSRNFIHTLIASGSNSTINGILVNSGTTSYQNNMIQLGLDTSGNSINIGAVINGINESGGINNFYFNSVYIGGSPASGSNNTFAFTSSVTSNTRNFRDNIFYNARSNSGSTGKHYAVSVAGTSPNPSGLTINNNIYFANGSGGVFGLFNGSDIANLSAWQAAVGQDANSFESNPQYINPNGSSSTVDLHIDPSVPTAVESNGFTITSISDDYDGQTRSSLTPVDIGADAGNFISSNPVTVAGAVSGNGSYLTLASAFTAINSASQTSANIVITINDNTTEPTTGAILNAGTWTTLKIQPGGGSARTVSANVNGGLPLIDLNGADNVTIDGLNSGGNSLTISNTSTSSTSGTSTIKFQTDATNNSITRCSILGSSTMSAGSDGGNIFFGSNPVSSGNDNNVVSNCDIGPAGSNLPTQSILFSGDFSIQNSEDTVRNCNIFDYFNATSQSAGVYIGNGNRNLFIKDNKFYQTASRTQTTGTQHSAIWADAPGFGGTGDYTISGNTIGYSSSSGTGTYSISGTTSTKFYSIYINKAIIGQLKIQGNTITKISLSGNISGTAFAAIYINSGNASIGTETGNTIGSQTDTGSISYSSSSSSISGVYGIYVTGSQSNSYVSNNNIGSITASNSSTGDCEIYCVRNFTPFSNFYLDNNIIGGAAANSINNKTSGSTSKTYGFYSNDGNNYVTANTFRNLTSAGGAGTEDNSSITGIMISSPINNNIVSRNTIYNFKNTNLSTACTINGIYFTNSANGNEISRNFIHTLMISGNTSVVNGIHSSGGSATYKNNMIRLGLDTSGNSMNIGSVINGINEAGDTNNFYFNSVYIGGNPTGGSNNTFAFTSSVTSNIRNFRDNIFYNARSNSGSTGKHYAVTVGGTSPNPSGLTINNNIYLANGSGGVFGKFNGSDVANLSAWQTAVGQDANSFESDPKFLTPNGSSSTADLHINPSVATAVESNGYDAGVTDDYDGQTRSVLTPVDIGADAGNFTALNIVNVSGALSGNGNYLTLANAFAAINSASQTSANITININDNTTEPPTGAILNAGAWTTLKIQPNGGASRTVSANVNGGSPLIDLNGADNVTIDGLNSGGNTLTISNSSTSSTSGTSTIRFQTDAVNNRITNCTILGSSTTSVSIGGTILFGLNSSITGNDNNVISSCNIGPAGSNLPSSAVMSYGTLSPTSLQNSGDTIRDCNIYDYFSSTSSSFGVNLTGGSTDIAVMNNKFYQTSAITQTQPVQHSAIMVNTVLGSNFSISGNTIGYSSSSGTGRYSLTGVSASTFWPIAVIATSSVNIQNNVMRNISVSGPFAGTGSLANFISICAGNTGTDVITGNIIGSPTDTGSISVVSSSASSHDVMGIFLINASSVSCSNNSIGGITASNSSTGATILYCIRSSAAATIQSNIIGGEVENSIYNKTNSASTRTFGVYIDNNTNVVTSNTIRNLTSAGGTGTLGNASVTGIRDVVTGQVQTISQNIIYNLKNTNTSADCHINGIYFNGNSSSNLISRNFIHTLIINRNSSDIQGIFADGGNATYQNNMVRIGLDTSGNSISNGITAYGIRDRSGANKYYFNSVYIGGTATGGSGSTYAFLNETTSGTRIFRNNIFYNGRTNSGSSGKHYSVSVAGTTPNPSGLTINNNVYVATGSGGFLGLFNGSDISTLSSWQTAVGQDANSYSSDPKFLNPNGSTTTVNLHIDTTQQTVVEANGFDVGVTDDYDGQTRSSLTPVDIGADAGNFIQLSKTLTMKMLVQGFYDSGSDQMIRDTVRVYLRNGSSPYAIVDTAKTYVDTSGNGVYTFSNASNNTPYYIQLKHRNSLETWSDSARSFVSGALSFDFTTSDAKAFGNNMLQVNSSPERYAIYSGDENQDGTIDVGDIIDIYNDALSGTSGYVVTDVNGDDFVDVSDIIIAYNNSINVVSVITP